MAWTTGTSTSELDDGAAAAQMPVERGHSGTWRLFRRPAHLLYAICGVELVGSVGLALSMGFRTAGRAPLLPHVYCVMLVLCGPLLRRIEKPRMAGAFETVGFLYGQSFALAALLYPMTAIAGPFADAELSSADRALGFDWLALANMIRDRPLLLSFLWIAYLSFNWQGAVIMPALFAVGRSARAWVTILGANIALLATILIYPFVPAQAAFTYNGISSAQYPNMTAQVAWLTAPAIHAIRDNGVRLITPDLLVAFVTFPSFHAAAAVLLVWAAWPVKALRWPFLLLNLCMAFSALIVGAHYLVDLIGGAFVAWISIVIARRVLKGFPSPA
ncbi:phosphatase PAP2 family protein [Sphingomonas sp.]|uniref:phosphatase PAP2 family protein n=1 Tax=Sphingomonas sp. TaxID=28214 RepID=UPI0025F26FB1|nr:phosphatase PAP2 family protein [Sphingomonas sp.]MBV9527430.1 phosphatase PAP2 family protein [Sphingomonas sp.]